MLRGARVTPDHNVMLAFTRMLAGPMDYTPGGFRNVTAAEFVPRNQQPMVMGTRAHQTALFVVFESPFEIGHNVGCILPVAPTAAFTPFPPVHRTYLQRVLWVALTLSPSRSAMTAICALRSSTT